eukprot:COSAG05_NODE_669_length_7998_cov_24.003671_3_plen_50_part_00
MQSSRARGGLVVQVLTKAKESKQWWKGYLLADVTQTPGVFPKTHVQRLN